MKPQVTLPTIAFLLASVCSFAQQTSTTFHFDSLLYLECARRFPYCGKLDLAQNFPNPFSTTGETEIHYKVIDAVNAAIIIYSLDGKQILTHWLDNGVGRLFIKGSDLQAGVYIYVLIVNGRQIAKKKFIVQLE